MVRFKVINNFQTNTRHSENGDTWSRKDGGVNYRYVFLHTNI